MATQIEKARYGHIVFTRSRSIDGNEVGEWSKWEEKDCKSISQAKKANGLNSKTVQSRPLD